jgi:general stress protein 26
MRGRMARQTHQQVQAGGDPTHGPHPDVANPKPGRGVGNDFPDAPEQPRPEHDQDKPDLDEFAARLGTDVLEDPSPARLGVRREGRVASVAEAASKAWRGPVSGALTGLAGGARDVADRLRSTAGHLTAERDDDIDLAALRARVAGIRTVMVTTGDGRGTMSSRPLTVQMVTEVGDVLFIVDDTAEWVKPSTMAINVAFVDNDRTWISVAGRGTLDHDEQVLDEMWDPAVEAFFPDGREHAVVLRVEADRWEYWTAPGKVRQLIEIGTSLLTDSAPNPGDSGTVTT